MSKYYTTRVVAKQCKVTFEDALYWALDNNLGKLNGNKIFIWTEKDIAAFKLYLKKEKE